MSCDVGRGHGSDLALLWLWCRLAATALIVPLAWEPPYAVGVALENTKRQRGGKKKKGSHIASPPRKVEAGRRHWGRADIQGEASLEEVRFGSQRLGSGKF